jgi:hypothetical protein
MSEVEQNSTVLAFPEPREVYLLDVHGDAMVEPLLAQADLWDGAGIAIRNPWDEDRFAPGVARGKDGRFIMEVGRSFGKLVFHPEHGWYCLGLVNRDEVMAGVTQQRIEEEIEVAKEASRSFTKRLVKRAAKKRGK